MSKSFSSSIAGASIFITIFTLLSRGLGFIREVVFAGFFGLHQDFEFYLVAAVVPATINIAIIVLGQNYFVPNYFRFDQNNKQKFFSQISSMFFLASCALAILLYVFANEIIHFYINVHSVEGQQTAQLIFKLFLPSIPLSALVSVYSAYLQAEKNFTAPIISNLFINIVIIFAVPFLSAGTGVVIIPVSYLVGMLVQTFYLFTIVRKTMHPGFTVSFFKHGVVTSLKNVFVFTLIIEIISQMFSLLDRYFLDEVQKGGIAALNYSITLFQLPLVILPFAVSTAIFPAFSELFQKNDINELRSKTDLSISVVVFMTVPIALIFIFFGDLIIPILFQRGNFTASDSILTFNTFRLYSLSLVFYAVYSVINKLFYSTNFLKQLLIIVISGTMLKILLNIFLVKILMQDGLALSSSIVYIYFCISGLYLIDKLKLDSLKSFMKHFFFYSFNGFTSLLIVFIIFGNFSALKNNKLISLSEIIIFVGLFLFNCYLVKDRSIVIFYNSSVELKNRIFGKK